MRFLCQEKNKPTVIKKNHCYINANLQNRKRSDKPPELFDAPAGFPAANANFDAWKITHGGATWTQSSGANKCRNGHNWVGREES